MRIQETWEQFICGIRSVAAAPSIDDTAYPEFGVITIAYNTEIAVGKLNSE